MLRCLLGGVCALILLAPQSAQAWWPRVRQTTVVQYAAPAPAVTSYYVAPAPAPVVTSYYVAPAPTVSYYYTPTVVAAPAPVVSYYAAPAPAVVTTTYTYRAPLLRPWLAPQPVYVYP